MDKNVSFKSFEAIQSVDVDKIVSLSEAELRPILPALVRMSLCAPLDVSKQWIEGRKQLLRILSGLEVVNSIVALLSVDFSALEQDARKELQIRQKLGGGAKENLLTSSIQHGLALEFERSDAARRLRLVISEILFIISQIYNVHGKIRDPNDFVQRPCELFETTVYLEEVSDVLCIAQAELPNLLPIVHVAEALLRVKYGSFLLCQLVVNVPDCYYEVCKYLIMNGEKQDEDTLGGRRRCHALRMLANMNPKQALTIRSLTVEECKMAGLAVALSLDHGKEVTSGNGVNDVISFISGLLLSSNASVRNWFSIYIRNAQKKKSNASSSMLYSLKKHLLQELANIIPSQGFHGNLADEHVVKASALIRLYCALKGIAGMKFSTEENVQLLYLVTCHPQPCAAGVRLVSLALCMLLACPFLQSPEETQAVTSWIQWLVKEGADFESTSGVRASFSEMLLLMAIHFHANQLHAVVDLVCSTLAMKIPVRPNSLSRMRIMFTQEIFTEEVVTAHAVTVAVTSNLSADITGFLPVHCVYQLLKSRAFAKYQVQIKDWIYKQICASSAPLHPLLPGLMEVFVNTIIYPTRSAGKSLSNQPLSESEILAVFQSSNVWLASKTREEANGDSAGPGLSEQEKGDSAGLGLTSQLLTLYYILLYEDCLLSHKKAAGNINKYSSYSTDLMTKVPIKYLLHSAQQHQKAYSGLYPSILRLVATHYPHLCLVEDWLSEELVDSPAVVHSLVYPHNLPVCSPLRLQEALMTCTEDPSVVLQLMARLSHLPAHRLMSFADVIVKSLQRILEPDVPCKVVTMVMTLWRHLNTVMPRRLRVMTVNILEAKNQLSPYSEEDIILDPLIVLRCDRRVFRCCPILEVVLQMLTAFLAASRAFLFTHLQASSGPSVNKKQDVAPVCTEQEKEELRSALVAAQESTAVQILLEICLPFEGEQLDGSMLNSVREVQCLVCCQLHQIFISDPGLVKLVHFQGYPSELLPITVAGIPSMHICLDFIPELLSQPQIEKQSFAVELVSHICQQYALPKSLSIARLSINVLLTNLMVLPGDERGKFFAPLLPSLVRIAKAFPPLYEDITSFLIQLGQVCGASLATSHSTHGPMLLSPKFEKMLTQDQLHDDRELKKLTQLTFMDILDEAVLNKGVF
ncbi:integrator complex subunit 2-like isoform X2 [Anneissia japonica]|uniref:integrator complex subunit 2-like isoform X2 n=1 Tax=Anneissia japonica TaxID=1529436 RepID=UPI001425B203|nr:integrator complex subunit 2-like isoform X2 [Anneissia japonica]